MWWRQLPYHRAPEAERRPPCGSRRRRWASDAAATARSELVLYADGWGDLADGDDQELAVRAIAEAIEAPSATRSTRALTLGLSVVLSRAGDGPRPRMLR